eukprot:612149-Amphidinium_carterae.1
MGEDVDASLWYGDSHSAEGEMGDNLIAGRTEQDQNLDRPVPEKEEEEEEVQHKVEINFDDWTTYFDSVTGVELDKNLVESAMIKRNAGGEPSLFAATPPLDPFRMIVSMAVWTWCPKKNLDFVHVRKAHLNGKARRHLVIRLPKEVGGGLAVWDKRCSCLLGRVRC